MSAARWNPPRPAALTTAALFAAPVLLLLAPALPRARAQDAPPVAAPSQPPRTILFVGVRSVPVAALEEVARQALISASAAESVAAARRAVGDAVVREYRRRGFPAAQVISIELGEIVPPRITVAEGVVRRIVVKGNRKTRTTTLLAALEIRAGDVYREDQAARDRDRLGRLGIFEDVNIAPVSPDEEAANAEANGADAVDKAPPAAPAAEDTVGLIDVLVRVRERRTGNVAATLGYGDRAGLVGYVDISETNFAGRAQRVSAQWQRFGRARLDENGFLRQEDARSAYNVSFFAPFLGSSGYAFGADVYDKNTIFQPLFGSDEETLRSYERRRGATVRAGRALGRGVSLFLSARRDEVGYDAVPFYLDPPIGEILEANATVGALGIEFTTDARDTLLSTTRGYYGSLLFENAGRYFGGERAFNRAVLDLRGYAPLARTASGPLVLAARLLGGSATGGGGRVPLSEQFFLGGYELLRGYDLYSIRGDRMLLASVEARIPLSSGVQGALFTDLGNAWAPGVRANLSDLRAGVGIGLRFLTPIGPLRLDAAYGNELKTYVSLGQAY